jgi:L-aspartate oxidase
VNRTIAIRDCDLLVLGAGLAGLRAALAALEAAPGLHVDIVSATAGPAGSSFANANGRLGMQVCRAPAEVESFRAEALSLAPPGRAEPALVRLLAEESAARLADLESLGATILREVDGSPRLQPGCFSPASRRAVVLTDLPGLYAAFRCRLEELGARFLAPWLVADILIASEAWSSRAAGALLVRPDGSEMLAISARATIMALGGPAPLFARHQAGRGCPGWALGLLAAAGAPLVNASFVQFMWTEAGSGAFWPIQELGRPGALVADGRGGWHPLPEGLRTLAPARGGHCPLAYDLPDAALDRHLLDRRDARGLAWVDIPGRGRMCVAPTAHCGNGGAAIDANGRTGLAGLYAAGECASGMHGANRIGGAMVAATQVFGARAGRSAAEELPPDMGQAAFADLTRHRAAKLCADPAERAGIAAALGSRLFALLPGRDLKSLTELATWLGGELVLARDWQANLRLGSANAMASHALCVYNDANAPA